MNDDFTRVIDASDRTLRATGERLQEIVTLERNYAEIIQGNLVALVLLERGDIEGAKQALFSRLPPHIRLPLAPKRKD